MVTKRFANAVGFASAVAALATGVPAAAQLTVSHDQASFDSSHMITTTSFAFPAAYDDPTYSYTHPVGSYTVDGVTFSSAFLTAFNGLPPTLESFAATTTVTSSGSVLGLLLEGEGGGRTIDYVVNGATSCTISFIGTDDRAFIGFDTGGLGPVSVTFSDPSANLDILSFQIGPPRSAVPEPAVWAMIITGCGLIGGTLRRRRAAAAFEAESA